MSGVEWRGVEWSGVEWRGVELELDEMRRNFVGCRKSSAVLYRNNLKIWFKDRYYCSSFKGMKDSTFE